MDGQRRFRRIPLNAEVRISRWLNKEGYELIDISLKGMLVRCGQKTGLKIGDEVKADIRPSPSLTLSFRAQLAHQEEDRLGFKFTDVDLETIAHLRRMFELNTGEAEKTLEELFRWADID